MRTGWSIVLVAGMMAGTAVPVGLIAQNNPPPSPAAPKPSANPEHERLKADAENAYQNSDFPKCIELTGKVLGQNPKDHVALYLRASARVELGQLQGNVKEVRAGVEDAREAMRFGGTEQVNYYLPYFYGMLGLAQIEKRREHAEVVIKFSDTILSRPNIKPEDQANIRYQRANARVFLGQFDTAAQEFETAIKLVPTHLGARLGLAECFVRMQKPDKAEAAFTAAVQAAPNNPLVYNNRGMFFQGQTKAQNAIADFTRAIELDPAFAVAFTNRGFTLMNDGNPFAAEADFAAAMKIDATQPLVYNLRGTARLAQGNPQGAIEDYTHLLKFNPQNPVSHADVAFAKYFAGDYAGAVAGFDEALKIDPNLRYLNPWRFWSLVKAGQGASATAKFTDVLDKPADKRDWSDALVCFLAGKITDGELAKAADQKEGPLRTAQTCELQYFSAERKAASKDANGATADYQKALDSKQAHLSAYRGAQYALKSFPKPATK